MAKKEEKKREAKGDFGQRMKEMRARRAKKKK
jgi:hypothetical protein